MALPWRTVSVSGASDRPETSFTLLPDEPSRPGTRPMEPYDSTEQAVVIQEFVKMLWSVTKDGGKKRAKGEKPEWWRDDSHEAAIFSHINKWKHGEKVDKDSGAHPLVHLAWRALAIAYQETHGKVDPANG